jgi:DNA-binding NtrC family response regulator
MRTDSNILVVDDDPLARDHLAKVLGHEGYRVSTVESGKEALEHIASETFDLALVDLRMEGMGGMELLEALRERTPDTAVVIVTAHPSLETVFEALRQGADDYIFKPCRITEVRESVRKTLERRRQGLLERGLEEGRATSGSD